LPIEESAEAIGNRQSTIENADGPCEYIIPACPPPRCRFAPDTLQLLAGGSFATALGPGAPEYNYVPLTARLGWYLTPPRSPGAVMAMLDYTTGVVTSGFGSYFTGPSLVVRYERWPDGVLVPYLQGGAGVVVNDGYREPFQRALGQAWEFYLQAGVGVRWRVSTDWSLDAEFGYQHISNGGTAERNGGLNNVGFGLGLTYTFGRP
jgi:hypothetical protein